MGRPVVVVRGLALASVSFIVVLCVHWQQGDGGGGGIAPSSALRRGPFLRDPDYGSAAHERTPARNDPARLVGDAAGLATRRSARRLLNQNSSTGGGGGDTNCNATRNKVKVPGLCDANYTANALYPPDAVSACTWYGGLLHALGMIYMFLGLAIVCDEFFVPALEYIAEGMGLSDDVAGATLMAAGGSAPELATSLIGTFVAESDVGFGTIMGSAVFNVLFVIGMCAVCSKEVLHLTWWPLFRDCTYYTLSLTVLAAFMATGRTTGEGKCAQQKSEITWWEALILFLLYLLYVTLMKFNDKLRDSVTRCLGRCRKTKTEPIDRGSEAGDGSDRVASDDTKKMTSVAPTAPAPGSEKQKAPRGTLMMAVVAEADSFAESGDGDDDDDGGDNKNKNNNNNDNENGTAAAGDGGEAKESPASRKPPLPPGVINSGAELKPNDPSNWSPKKPSLSSLEEQTTAAAAVATTADTANADTAEGANANATAAAAASAQDQATAQSDNITSRRPSKLGDAAAGAPAVAQSARVVSSPKMTTATGGGAMKTTAGGRDRRVSFSSSGHRRRSSTTRAGIGGSGGRRGSTAAARRASVTAGSTGEPIMPFLKPTTFRAGILRIMLTGKTNLETIGHGLVTAISGDVDATFAEVDQDGSGEIDYDEFKAVLTKLQGYPAKDAMVIEAMKAVDADGDGMISKAEFEVWYAESENRVMADVHKVFVELDVSGDGKLDIGEVRHLMERVHGDKASASREVNKFICGASTRDLSVRPEERQIDFEEFKAWYVSTMLFQKHKDELQHLDEEAEDEAEDPGNPLCEFPESIGGRISYVLSFPLMVGMVFTIPDCRRPKFEKWAPASFFMSIVWIAIFSYFMVWWATQLGDAIGIPPKIMGLTFLAAGTSIPDLMTSVIVARQGFGDMAVSSSVGSNIFDILVGLPIPWFLKTLVDGEPLGLGGDDGGELMRVCVGGEEGQ